MGGVSSSPAYLRTLSTSISPGGRGQLPGGKSRPCRTLSTIGSGMPVLLSGTLCLVKLDTCFCFALFV